MVLLSCGDKYDTTRVRLRTKLVRIVVVSWTICDRGFQARSSSNAEKQRVSALRYGMFYSYGDK